MNPTRDVEHTLVDLVDTILDKGVVIHADVIVSLAGVPLIGINLKAAIAGMETMLRYGMMEAWDERVRSQYAREIAGMDGPKLAEGETVVLHTTGSHFLSEGIYHAWRPGKLYLTDRRVLLFRRGRGEALFEVALEDIRALSVTDNDGFVGTPTKRLVLHLHTLGTALLNAEDVEGLRSAIEGVMTGRGLRLETAAVPLSAPSFLEVGEVVVRAEKVWYREPATEVNTDTWRPGRMYVTNRRACWSRDARAEPSFVVLLGAVTGLSIEQGSTDGPFAGRDRAVLLVTYAAADGKNSSLFAGGEETLMDVKQVMDDPLAMAA